MFSLYIFIFICNLVLSQKIIYPILFTTIRQVPLSLHPNKLATYLGVPLNITSEQYKSYNFISFDGWTFNNSLYSACKIWANADNYFGKSSRFGINTSIIQKEIKKIYNKNNIKILVTAFSIYEYPFTQNYDPKSVALNLSLFMFKNNLDGVTIQLHDIPSVVNSSSLIWIYNFTKYLRENILDGILVYNIYASYFQKGTTFNNLISKITNLIDFYVIKFYDLMTIDYNDQSSLFTASKIYKYTSFNQLVQSGIPPNKIIIGKPSSANDTNNPQFYIEINLLSNYFLDSYKNWGWYGGYGSNDLYNDLYGVQGSGVIEGLKNLCDKNENCI